MPQPEKPISLIFVCLGNYCRSPMAEAIFNKLAKEACLSEMFEVSSAGTRDWDVGLRPDPRSQELLRKNNYPLDPQKRARKITPQEIRETDLLIAMTQRVARELGQGENVSLLMSYIPETEELDIPDPYPTDTFPESFALIEKGVFALIKVLKENFRTMN